MTGQRCLTAWTNSYVVLSEYMWQIQSAVGGVQSQADMGSLQFAWIQTPQHRLLAKVSTGALTCQQVLAKSNASRWRGNSIHRGWGSSCLQMRERES